MSTRKFPGLRLFPNYKHSYFSRWNTGPNVRTPTGVHRAHKGHSGKVKWSPHKWSHGFLVAAHYRRKPVTGLARLGRHNLWRHYNNLAKVQKAKANSPNLPLAKAAKLWALIGKRKGFRNKVRKAFSLQSRRKRARRRGGGYVGGGYVGSGYVGR